MIKKGKIIAIVLITLVLSTLSIINMIGGNKNEYTNNGSSTNSNANSTTSIEKSTTITTTSTSITTTKKKTTTKATTRKTETQKVGTYKLTHYGPDCKGCSGNTASGYKVTNTIYYNDKIYGNLRIVAMSGVMPLYSVIKIKNYKLGGDIYAIVLDRGVGSGVIDLLVESESKASNLGIQKNVEIEVLRNGK